MNHTISPCRVNWHKFWVDYFLWIAGLLISFVPLFVKHLFEYETAEKYSLYLILNDAVSDLDFFYIFVNAFLIWYLQCEFTVRDNRPAGTFCRRLSVILSFLLSFCYFLFYLLPRFQSVYYTPHANVLNLSMLFCTLIIGAILYIDLSMEER